MKYLSLLLILNGCAPIVRAKKIQSIGLDAYINEMGGGY